MVAQLDGQRIVLFEARLEQQLAELVRRRGGVPVCVPAVRELKLPVAPLVAELVRAAGAAPSPAFIFSTGVGVTGLFDEARALGLDAVLKAAVLRGVSVCRGPKPVTALYAEGIAASVKAPSPHTTTELLSALTEVQVTGRLVIVVHHGERNEPLLHELRARGARAVELFLYMWALPEDQGPLRAAVHELVQGRIAAAAFTTQIQARHLLHVAADLGLRDALLDALRTRVIVAAIGPTCARALVELGAPPHVVPDPPKMAPLLTALVERLSEQAAA